MNDSEPVPNEQADATERGDPAVAEAIRGTGLGLLIGGGVCLYFGFTLLVDAPGSVSEEEAERWFAVDHIVRWSLRAVGIAFLVCAAWAWTGQRSSMLLATFTEGVFTLLMVAMAVESTVEARADGGFDAFAIILVILAVIGFGGARRCWRLYVHTGREQAIEST